MVKSLELVDRLRNDRLTLNGGGNRRKTGRNGCGRKTAEKRFGGGSQFRSYFRTPISPQAISKQAEQLNEVTIKSSD